MDEVSHAGTGGCPESWRVWVQPDSGSSGFSGGFGWTSKRSFLKESLHILKLRERVPPQRQSFMKVVTFLLFSKWLWRRQECFFFFFLSSTWESNLSCRELQDLIPVVLTLLCFGVLLVYTTFGDHHSDLLLSKSETFNSFLFAFLNIYHLFIFSCTGSSLLCTVLWQAGATLCCHARTSHCDVSWSAMSYGARTPGHTGISSCSMWAQPLQFPGSRAWTQ